MNLSILPVEPCPKCEGKGNVGRISPSQYYCRYCFLQFAVMGKTATVFHIQEDGSLRRVNDVELGKMKKEKILS